MSDNPKVTQFGLWSDNQQEIKNLAERIARFNNRWQTNVVLDVAATNKGDSLCDHPHAKLAITFDNHEVQDKFWLE